jgi:hypothetical protein
VVVLERRLAGLLRESAPQEDSDFAALLVANIAGKLRLTVRATRGATRGSFPLWLGIYENMPSSVGMQLLTDAEI